MTKAVKTVKRLHWNWLNIGEPRCRPRKARYCRYELAPTAGTVTCRDCLKYMRKGDGRGDGR